MLPQGQFENLFSHASAEVRGKNTPKRKVASTGDQTHNHQVMSPTRSPLSHPGWGIFAIRYGKYFSVYKPNTLIFEKQIYCDAVLGHAFFGGECRQRSAFTCITSRYYQDVILNQSSKSTDGGRSWRFFFFFSIYNTAMNAKTLTVCPRLLFMVCENFFQIHWSMSSN